MAIDTLFQPNAGGGGGGASDYLNDNFLDTTKKPASNIGLSSTALTNPLSFNFAASDEPRYGFKILRIKRLVEITDPARRIANKPTYEIEFMENTPSTRGYVAGNIRLREQSDGKLIESLDAGDIFGITGLCRQVAWVLEPSTASTATATRSTDGVTGSTISFANQTLPSLGLGVPNLSPILHNSTLELDGLHDFRITADQAGVLKLVGIAVYFENASANIALPGGTSFVDKSSVTTTATTLDVPGVTTPLGAAHVIRKTAQATVVVETDELELKQSIAVGAINTNLVTVTTGEGVKFATGDLIRIGALTAPIGTTAYVGVVQSVASDVLTVSPTLAAGWSNSIYVFARMVPTLAISPTMFIKTKTLDLAELKNSVNPLWVGQTTYGNYEYQDNDLQISAFGLIASAVNSKRGLVPAGVPTLTSGLMISGNFQALELEGESVGRVNISAQFARGYTAFTIDQTATGPFRYTLLTDGSVGNHIVRVGIGASNTTWAMTRVNTYQLGASCSPLLLSRFQTRGLAIGENTYAATGVIGGQSAVPLSRTTMNLPNNTWSYVSADRMELTGPWARETTLANLSTGHRLPFYVASQNASLPVTSTLRYFGRRIAFVGSGASTATFSCVVDGVTYANAKGGEILGVTSFGWHTAVLQGLGASLTRITLEGAMVERPTLSPLRSAINYDAKQEFARIPQSYIQQNAPQGAIDGDMWIERKQNPQQPQPNIWLRLNELWNQLSVVQATDDPSAFLLAVSHGATSGDVNTGSQSLEVFNEIGWSNGPSANGTNGIGMNASDAAYNSRHHVVDGSTSTFTPISQHQVFNKTSWISASSGLPTARGAGAVTSFNGKLFQGKGLTAGPPGGASSLASQWNDVSWASATSWATARYFVGQFRVGAILYMNGGNSSAGTVQSEQEQRNFSDAVTSGTALGSENSNNGGQVNQNLGALVYIGAAALNQTAATFNGSAWSSAFATIYNKYSAEGCGTSNNAAAGRMYTVKGNPSGGFLGASVTGEVYNGSAVMAIANASTAKLSGCSSGL